MIKSGIVKVFDEKFQHLLDYYETSFFGEYQILFDLKAGVNYRTGGKNITSISLRT